MITEHLYFTNSKSNKYNPMLIILIIFGILTTPYYCNYIYQDETGKNLNLNDVTIELIKFNNKIILACISDIFQAYPMANTYWYRLEHGRDRVLLSVSPYTQFIKHKMILSNSDDDTTLSYVCSVFKNREEVFSKPKDVNLYREINNIIEPGHCIDYPKNGTCSKLTDFPSKIMVNGENSITEREKKLNDLIREYNNFSIKNNEFSEYFLPFLCFSEYLFCGYENNTTKRIHHEDLVNMLSSIKNSQFPMNDEMTKRLLNIYQANKNEIKLKTESKLTIRYSVNKIYGAEIKECLTGTGKDYMGKINISYSKKPCLPWLSVPLSILLFPMHLKDMEHNYCRNPSGYEKAPYCYVDNRSIELCVIPKCETTSWILSHLSEGKKYVPFFLVVLLLQLLAGGVYATYRYNYVFLEKYHERRRRKYFKRFKKISQSNKWDSNLIFSAKNVDILDDHKMKNSILSSKGYSQTINPLFEIDAPTIHRQSSGSSRQLSCYTFTLPMILQLFYEYNLDNIIEINPSVVEYKIPYVFRKDMELMSMLDNSDNIFFAKISSVFIQGFMRKKNPAKAFKFQRMCVVRSCEDSWRNIERRLYDTQHSSISKFIGVMINDESVSDIPVGLIFEPCLSTDLREFFKNDCPMGWPKKVKDLVDILYQITSGIDFLQKKCIVHGDIALRNCGAFQCPFKSKWPVIKLTDYAKFKPTYKEDYIYIDNKDIIDVSEVPRKGLYIPLKWMAPEILTVILSVDNFAKLSTCRKYQIELESLSKVPGSCEGDIYSLGVMIWELFNSGQRPYENIPNDDFKKLFAVDQIPLLVTDERTGVLNLLIQSCTSKKTSERPSIGVICQKVKDSLNNIYRSHHNRSSSC